MATISQSRPDAERTTTNDTDTIEVTARAKADLWVTLERTSAEPTPDGFVTHRATWGNSGATAAHDSRLAVEDDDDLLLTTGQPPGTFGRVFTLGDAGLVPAGATGTQALHYRVRRVLPSASNPLTTAVSVTTPTADANAGNDRASVTDVIAAQANLQVALILTSSNDPPQACDEVIATTTWANTGSTAAVGASVELTFDASLLTVEDAGGGGVAGPGIVRWNLPSAGVGENGGFVARLRLACILPSTVNELPFVSSIASGTPEADPSDDVAEDSLFVEACPDLVASLVSVVSEPEPALAGGLLRVDVEVVNVGATHASSASLLVRWSDAAAVVALEDVSPGAVPDGTDGLTWSLGRVDAGAAPVARTLALRLAQTFPAYANPLDVTAVTSALECDTAPLDNEDAASLVVTAAPDLVLSTAVTNTTGSGLPVRPGDVLRYEHVVSNVGASPAQGVRVTSDFDPSLLQVRTLGPQASLGAGAIVHRRGANALAPGAAWSSWATFSVVEAPQPPVARTLSRTAHADEIAFGTARDAHPGDNDSATGVSACYLAASVTPLSPGDVCLGSAVTLRADASSEGSWTYQWSVSAGSMIEPGGRYMTYFPPAAAGNYTVTLSVSDPASGCAATVTHVVTVTAACQSCGCQSARPNPQYDGNFERSDLPGSRTVAPGETVGFRVWIKETNNSRSGWLLGGPGGTSLQFTDGTSTYQAWLPHDQYLECQDVLIVEFATAEVPEAMSVGEYNLSFVWRTRDTCEEIHERADGTGGDRVSVVETLGVDPGVSITDWGPRVIDAGGRP